MKAAECCGKTLFSRKQGRFFTAFLHGEGFVMGEGDLNCYVCCKSTHACLVFIMALSGKIQEQEIRGRGKAMIHIAIVEDEPLYIRQLQDYITRYSQERGRQIKVTVFSDGEDITDNYQADYDIILMDIQMRFMDGMTAAEKVTW